MAELQPIIVFHGRHFVLHLGICNPICVKLLQIMSDAIPRNLKKRRLYLKPFSCCSQTRHTHTQTHTTIAIRKMQCVAFRLKMECKINLTNLLNYNTLLSQHRPVHRLNFWIMVHYPDNGALSLPMIKTTHYLTLTVTDSVFLTLCCHRRVTQA